jgi:hypothetical protein
MIETDEGPEPGPAGAPDTTRPVTCTIRANLDIRPLCAEQHTTKKSRNMSQEGLQRW